MKFKVQEPNGKEYIIGSDKIIEILLSHAAKKKEISKDIENILVTFLSMPLTIDAIMHRGLAEMIILSFRLGYYYNQLTKQNTITIMEPTNGEN